MATRRLIVFKHESDLGNAPSHLLFDRVTVTKDEDANPPRQFSDYNVNIDTENLPAGVQIIQML